MYPHIYPVNINHSWIGKYTHPISVMDPPVVGICNLDLRWFRSRYRPILSDIHWVVPPPSNSGNEGL